MRWLRRLGLLFLIVLVGGGSAGFFWLRTSLPVTEGEIAYKGLKGPVEIVRDKDGVPKIRAESEHDAYFALGVVHAQDRLWQMDFQRRLGQGRLSEVLGKPTLPTDRYMRTLGLYRLAEASIPHLSRETVAALEAYAKGVNAWLDTHREDWWRAWPIEFYLLRYRPEPWRPADSLVWGRTMGIFLARNWREEVFRAQLIRRLGEDSLETLLPPYPADAPRTLAGLPENPIADGSASNVWAISGNRTASGKPLLANDPHLQFRTPALWYLARVAAPGLDVTGGTVPGMPFTVLGHNRDIAWGFTTAETDVQDLFIETILPDRPDHYVAPDGPRPLKERLETIAVKGEEPLEFTVRSTRHGPVVSGLSPEVAALAGPGEIVSLAAASLEPDDRTADALYALNRASDWNSFETALKSWHSPHQNIVMAAREGTIGMISPARVPVRRSGSGEIPAQGSDGAQDWSGFIPCEELPRVRNPARGSIVNANNPTAGLPNFKYRLGRNRSPGYRAKRIEERLAGSDRHDMSGSARLQHDVVSLMARDLLPLMSKIEPSTTTGRNALALLREWDGSMDRNKPEPFLFSIWLLSLKRAIFADELGDLFPSFSGLRTQPIKRALTDDPRWCDDRATEPTENCSEMLTQSLETAVKWLEKETGKPLATLRWGDVHTVSFDHPVLGRVPVLNRLFNIRLPMDGGTYTVNRAHFRPDSARAPFASVHGAGLKAVYDLSDLSRSRFMVAPGQSGNRLSALYSNLAERWRDGRYLTPGQSDITSKLTLSPAR